MQFRSSDWQGKMLGRYRLLRVLGHGTMGEVWQAEDTELHRQVAAKLLPSVLANQTSYLQSFTREARLAASLEHPHILPVHDFGEEHAGDEIIPYLIMPLITGGSLRDRMNATQGLMPVEECLHYLRQAAQAIDYAHSRKVLHRDIKPANMLLQGQWLLLADFGLARLLATTTPRQPSSMAGTPAYIAPEQIQGHAEAASDDYSLAIIAYQLLTGQKPFASATPLEALMKQLQTMPPSPRQFNPHLPVATELVFFIGLAKQPDARFGSCTAFVDALEASLRPGALQPSSSDPDATLLAPWSRRSITAQATQPVTPSAFLPVTPANQVNYPLGPLPFQQAGPVPPFQIATQSAGQAPVVNVTTERETPPSSERKVNRRGLLIGGSAAAAALAVGGTGLAYYLHTRPTALARKPAPPPGPQKLIKGIPVLRLAGHTGDVQNVAWHPSGRYLTTSGDDTHVMLWDVGASLQKRTGTTQIITKPLRDWKFSQDINSNEMSWSYDGRTLAVAGTRGSDILSHLYLINSDQQSTPMAYIDSHLTDNLPNYFMLAWSPVADFFAVSIFPTMNAEIWQRGKQSGPIKSLIGPPVSSNEQGLLVENLAWSNDGTLLAGLRNDSDLVIWDAKTGKLLQPNLATPNRVVPNGQLFRRSAVAWSPGVRTQVASTLVDTAVVTDALKNKTLFQLGTDDPAAHTTVTVDGTLIGVQVNGLAWSPNGRYLAGSYEHSRQVYIWDTQNRHPQKTSDGLHIQDLLFGAQDGHGVLLPPKKGALPASVDVTIVDMAWSPDGRYLATASNDTTVIIWQVDGA